MKYFTLDNHLEIDVLALGNYTHAYLKDRLIDIIRELNIHLILNSRSALYSNVYAMKLDPGLIFHQYFWFQTLKNRIQISKNSLWRFVLAI